MSGIWSAIRVFVNQLCNFFLNLFLITSVFLLQLARIGMDVVLISRNPEKLQDVASEIGRVKIEIDK